MNKGKKTYRAGVGIAKKKKFSYEKKKVGRS
jgi:hypothetical protein